MTTPDRSLLDEGDTDLFPLRILHLCVRDTRNQTLGQLLSVGFNPSNTKGGRFCLYLRSQLQGSGDAFPSPCATPDASTYCRQRGSPIERLALRRRAPAADESCEPALTKRAGERMRVDGLRITSARSLFHPARTRCALRRSRSIDRPIGRATPSGPHQQSGH